MMENPALAAKHHRFAHIEVAVGAVMISFSPVWVKLAGVAPTVSAFYRVFVGGLILWLLVALRRRKHRTSRRILVIACALGFVLAFDLTAWHQAIGYIGPGMSTILGNFQVFILAAFGLFFLGERLTLRFGIAVLAAMTGLFLMFGLDWTELSANYKLGIALGLLTACLYSVFLIGLRVIQSRPESPHPTATMAWLSLITSCTLAVGITGTGGSFAIPDVGAGVALVSYAIVSHVVGWVLIADGLPKIAASRAGLLLLLQPSLAFVWDMVLFGRATTTVELVGAGLALVAIYMGTVRDGEGR
jgi:drug/metabolite transporter (DMT)-like permease